ncbi:polysaccharide deacetylase family protein [Acetivibrio cellulolyticus]|uniref:polysaccharide deacetylase family protein n=1 Tax=Acetivibrio cellulolyticus TaxID=35830 RepID=UPI0001E2EBF9|nr:polysaccharide deacetylase family protein [Acetivibrio cellulolyticus]
MIRESISRKKIVFFILLISLCCSSCSTQNNMDKSTMAVSNKVYENGSSEKVVIPAIKSADPTVVSSPTPAVELVTYKGTIQHIFFHPLIAYTERAFDNDSMSKGYNDWMVTVKEFKKILESLYKKDFILVAYRDVYETKNENGKIVLAKKELKLPAGKKPLIVSIDDLNYYDYMLENGNVYKLVLDENGDVATYSVAPDGKEIISMDNEIVPILDTFVEQHNNFSFNGAKGIIASTGYEGILGYRTNKLDSLDYEKEKSEALKVVKRLKETGWTFACHGYGHLDDVKVSRERFERDTERWKKEVETLVGPTQIYIYPYGSAFSHKDPRLKYLLNNGFNILCSVGIDDYLEKYEDCALIDRKNIDGYSFRHHSEKLKDLFDVNEVIDSARPAQ